MLPARPQFRLTSQCAQLCQDGGTAPSWRTSRQILLCLKMLAVMSHTVLVTVFFGPPSARKHSVVTKPLAPRCLRQLRGGGVWRGEGVWRGGAEPGEEGHMSHSVGQGAHQNWMQPSTTTGASVCPGPAVGLVSPHQLPHPRGHTQDNLRHPGMPCPHLSWAGGWF